MVVWGAQSRVFGSNFGSKSGLTRFFEGVLVVFRSVRITQKNASVWGRLMGVSMVLKGRFSYNYTASFRWRQQDVPVRLILRACTHNACRCDVLYNRSAQARSEGRFRRRVLTACEAMPTQCQANVNLMHNKRGVQPLKM